MTFFVVVCLKFETDYQLTDDDNLRGTKVVAAVASMVDQSVAVSLANPACKAAHSSLNYRTKLGLDWFLQSKGRCSFFILQKFL